MHRQASPARARQARFALAGVAAAWGLTFTLTKLAVADLSPAAFVCARFVIAVVFLLPWMPRFQPVDRVTLPFGVALGVLNIAVHLLQATSLTHIGAARCGFLAGSHLVFVPIFELFAGLGRPRSIDGVAIALCLGGLFLLTGADLSEVGRGDLQAVGAEIFFALYMVVTLFAARQRANIRWLTLVQMATTAAISGALSFGELRLAVGSLSDGLWACILTCGLLCTLMPIYMQMRFQPYLRPSHAALLLSLEPIFAGGMAFAVLHESMSPSMLAGAGLMLLAAFLPSWRG